MRKECELPSGTVTFLFTDIEGSTRLLHQLGKDYAQVLEDHRELMRASFAKWRGQEVDTQGDSSFVAFGSAGNAIQAAVEIQQKLHVHKWPGEAEVRVRMGVHTGEPWVAKEGFVGVDVHRAARISSIGYGGQVLLSEATAALVQDDLSDNVRLQELGEHRLKDIPRPEPINQLVIEGLRYEFPMLKSLDARPNNLPSQLTTFVGRQDELVELEALIANPEIRLVSIVGTGGMGKTRLALATAEEQLFATHSSNGKEIPRFPDGVFFIPLAPLESEDQILTAIAKAVNFQFYPGGDPQTQLVDYFREKRSLLVMDNFEHILSGSSILTEILQAAGGVKVLVTSREKLNLRAENVYALYGMAFPEIKLIENDLANLQKQYSAINLFSQSASQVKPGLAWTLRDMRTIAKICSMVEGMPLGIELAAGWVEMLSLDKIAAEIHSNLDFLEAQRRDAPDRHQSIRAVFEYTWDMLSEQERKIFRRISVFRGGFTLEAVEKVTNASISDIRTLVGKSLIHLDPPERYKIHELLRQYSAEKSEKNPEEGIRIQNRHSEYFAEFVHQRDAAIRGGDQADALEEMDNIQTGWRWAIIQRKAPEIRKQIHSLWWIHEIQGWFQEAIDTFDWAIEELRSDESNRDIDIAFGLILGLSAVAWYRIRDQEKAIRNYEKCISILANIDAVPELAWAYMLSGHILTSRDYAEQMKRLKNALAIFEELDIKWAMAFSLNTMGKIALENADYDDGETYHKDALQINTNLNDRRGMAWSTVGLGYGALYRGDYLIAKKLIEKSTALWKDIGYKLVVAGNLSTIGKIDLIMGKFEEAQLRIDEAFAITLDMGWQFGIAESILDLGAVAFAQGEYGTAKEQYEKALTRFQNLNDQAFIGWSRSSLGNVAAAIGDFQGARKNYLSALEIGVDIDFPHLFLYILVGLSTMLEQVGNEERAVELAALVFNHARSEPMSRERAKKLLNKLRMSLPSEVFEAAQKRGKAWNLDETVHEYITELAG